ncbi:hypothetical protein BWD121_005660 [Bartonella sp. WD12.1]|nr:hypothetical protein BWD121_005660 [Bartonella sp. WD12.1]
MHAMTERLASNSIEKMFLKSSLLKTLNAKLMRWPRLNGVQG